MQCDIALVYLVQTFKNVGRHYKSTIYWNWPAIYTALLSFRLWYA